MLKKIIHHEAQSPSDYFALLCTKFLRVFADTFFAGRYGHRAVVFRDGCWCTRDGGWHITAPEVL